MVQIASRPLQQQFANNVLPHQIALQRLEQQNMMRLAQQAQIQNGGQNQGQQPNLQQAFQQAGQAFLQPPNHQAPNQQLQVQNGRQHRGRPAVQLRQNERPNDQQALLQA